MAKWVKLQEEHNPEEVMNKEAGNKQDGIKALGKVEKLMLFARVDPRVDVSTVEVHITHRIAQRAKAKALRKEKEKDLEEKEGKEEERQVLKEDVSIAEERITPVLAPRGTEKVAKAFQHMQ